MPTYRPTTRPPWVEAMPNNGQCVCQIHDEFEAEHGYTVDTWYEMHPDVEPYWMQRCGNCELFAAMKAAKANPAPIAYAEPAPVQRHYPAPEPAPVHRATQAHAATQTAPSPFVAQAQASAEVYPTPEPTAVPHAAPPFAVSLRLILAAVALVAASVAGVVFGAALIAVLPVIGLGWALWASRGWLAGLFVQGKRVEAKADPVAPEGVRAEDGAAVDAVVTARRVDGAALVAGGQGPRAGVRLLGPVEVGEPIEPAQRRVKVAVGRK